MDIIREAERTFPPRESENRNRSIPKEWCVPYAVTGICNDPTCKVTKQHVDNRELIKKETHICHNFIRKKCAEKDCYYLHKRTSKIICLKSLQSQCGGPCGKYHVAFGKALRMTRWQLKRKKKNKKRKAKRKTERKNSPYPRNPTPLLQPRPRPRPFQAPRPRPRHFQAPLDHPPQHFNEAPTWPMQTSARSTFPPSQSHPHLQQRQNQMQPPQNVPKNETVQISMHMLQQLLSRRN
jgi:hypothetical protein